MKTPSRSGRTTRTAALAAGLLLLAAPTACGGGGGSAGGTPRGGATEGGTAGGTGTPSPAASPTTPTRTPGTSGSASEPPTGQLGTRTTVYFLHDGKLSAAPRRVTGTGTAKATINALLAGPSAYEKQAARSTSIPSGTRANGISVRDAVATVDLTKRFGSGGGSASPRARLAQVVFTATQFPGIRGVRFRLDGRPVTVFGGERLVLDHPLVRADFEDLAPAVLVESPAIGDTVHSPVRVRGSADVFEGVFRLRLTDAAGRVAADVRVRATSGTGTRGTFDVTVPYHASRTGGGTLTAYYLSAKDGSPVIVDRIPLGVGG
jgi:Immunoglobulin-like domain of bacterial spore germination/Sporulation and spore germination